MTEKTEERLNAEDFILKSHEQLFENAIEEEPRKVSEIPEKFKMTK